jgi:hypothetical protein
LADSAPPTEYGRIKTQVDSLNALLDSIDGVKRDAGNLEGKSRGKRGGRKRRKVVDGESDVTAVVELKNAKVDNPAREHEG